ncbi:hypothetical protein CBER1_00741 [Cercospora berteroae]|uniref:Tautomerase cis-CaaD-like domain-containing protein n=1 Tax=Cercospora berteroae TaxID=357750 RepID=A0A2S6C969_9PEZI|nr:hypothetical protein CBER1_00741 [Cercospora berteroae]
MPIWKIFHSPGIFEDATERHELAKSITDYYVVVGLPAYYVNVQFWPLPADRYFTGANPVSKTVFVEIIHIARRLDPTNKQMRTRMKNRMDKILKPYTIDRGIHLEYAIAEGAAELWRINGIDPPESFGPDEKEQAAHNKKLLDELRKNFDYDKSSVTLSSL